VHNAFNEHACTCTGILVESRILETKIDNIFEFDKGINFIALVNSDGNLVKEFARPGAVHLEPHQELKTLFLKVSIAMGMSTPMNKYHGKLRSAVLVKEKVSLIFLELQAKYILIWASPDFNLGRLEELYRQIDQLGIS